MSLSARVKTSLHPYTNSNSLPELTNCKNGIILENAYIGHDNAVLQSNTEKEQNTSGEKPRLRRDASAYASAFNTRMETLIHPYNHRIVFLKSIIVFLR